MSTAEAMVAATSGTWDKFDACNMIVEKIGDLVDDAEVDTELHLGMTDELFGVETKMHMFDPKAAWRERLVEAKAHIDAACLICQEVLAEVP